MIKNQADLAAMLSAGSNTKASIERAVYKYTDCGAFISLRRGGITLGSIVEGADFGTATYSLAYPFSEDDYRAREKAVEAEASAIWEWANVTYDRRGRRHPNGKTPAEMGVDAPDVDRDYLHLNPDGRSA